MTPPPNNDVNREKKMGEQSIAAVAKFDDPAPLPADPKGYTKRMKMHLNFGREGGAATYAIYDPDGDEMPITYQYDTRPGGITGFSLTGVEQVFASWADLAAYWPTFVKARPA